MANFLFACHGLSSHLDFGGGGLLKTAIELNRKGHKVEFVFSKNSQINAEEQAKQIIMQKGLRLGELDDLFLTYIWDYSKIESSVDKLSKYIIKNEVDVLVIDRLCVAAQFSSFICQIPWAVIGGDGLRWSPFKYSGWIFLNHGTARNNTIKKLIEKFQYDSEFSPDVNSMWAISPFLNISYLSKHFFYIESNDVIPAYSHFVGLSKSSRKNVHKDIDLLVTFGTSFPQGLINKITNYLIKILRKKDLKINILTGDKEVTTQFKNIFKEFSSVCIYTWVDYDEIFPRSRIILGHGGTAHIWYAIKHGVPVITVPNRADQFFNSKLIENKQAGKVFMIKKRDFVNRLLPALSINVQSKKLEKIIEEILNNPTYNYQISKLKEQMESGGGITAAVSLLEELSKFKKPIVDHSIPCCCC